MALHADYRIHSFGLRTLYARSEREPRHDLQQIQQESSQDVVPSLPYPSVKPDTVVRAFCLYRREIAGSFRILIGHSVRNGDEASIGTIRLRLPLVEDGMEPGSFTSTISARFAYERRSSINAGAAALLAADPTGN